MSFPLEPTVLRLIRLKHIFFQLLCYSVIMEESAPKPAAVRHVWGGAGNGGLAVGCLRPEEPSSSARRRRSVGPSTKDVQYHRTALRVRAEWLSVPGHTAARSSTFFLFFPLSPMSSLSLLILPSPFLSPRLPLPPGTLWPQISG